jgi:hypothetical protein
MMIAIGSAQPLWFKPKSVDWAGQTLAKKSGERGHPDIENTFRRFGEILLGEVEQKPKARRVVRRVPSIH